MRACRASAMATAMRFGSTTFASSKYVHIARVHVHSPAMFPLTCARAVAAGHGPGSRFCRAKALRTHWLLPAEREGRAWVSGRRRVALVAASVVKSGMSRYGPSSSIVSLLSDPYSQRCLKQTCGCTQQDPIERRRRQRRSAFALARGWVGLCGLLRCLPEIEQRAEKRVLGDHLRRLGPRRLHHEPPLDFLHCDLPQRPQRVPLTLSVWPDRLRCGGGRMTSATLSMGCCLRMSTVSSMSLMRAGGLACSIPRAARSPGAVSTPNSTARSRETGD